MKPIKFSWLYLAIMHYGSMPAKLAHEFLIIDAKTIGMREPRLYGEAYGIEARECA